jgi:hypothetical protein
LVAILLPPPPLSLRVRDVPVPFIVLVCTVALVAQVNVMPDPPALTLLPVAFTPAPGEFNTIPVVPPTNALVRIVSHLV